MLRTLTLDEFGELLLTLPNEEFPHLSSILPSATPDEVQVEWTGSCGVTLLRQSVSFLNFVAAAYTEFSGRPLRNVNVLDFGCGWGRLLRLLAFYNNPEFNFGCDAWPVSLDHARQSHVDRVTAGLALSEATPQNLPYPPATFDLVYAFSIFTHLSEATAVACMNAIRKAIKPDGLAIITVRPIEFWDYNPGLPEEVGKSMKMLHAFDEIAFYPSGGKSHDANGRPVAYGDTSIPLSIIERKFPGWSVVRAGVTMVDIYQIFVLLRPV